MWSAHSGSQASSRGYTEREREDCVVASRHNRVIIRKKINCFHLSSVQFKSTSSKSVCVVGLMAMMADDPEHPDVFLLTDSEHGETHTHNIGKAKQKVLTKQSAL